jgi:4-diphosphocytidyl-2C-methyl-D-erythritol kinase
VSGIGERVEPLAAPAATGVVLVHPDFRLSTGEVFAELRAADLAADRPGGNDLLAPALRLRPGLADVMRRMARAGVEPRLTGSGPTLFGLLDDPERATATIARLRAAGLSVTETRLRPAAARIVELGDAPNDAGAVRQGMG